MWLNRAIRTAITYGVTEDGAVLIRPDGFVAWRATSTTGDLTQALRTVLARD